MTLATEHPQAPLRVLTVSRWYPSHDSPGRGSFVADLVRATSVAGVEARVVSFDRVLVRGRLEDRDAVLADARAAYERVATPTSLFVTPVAQGAPGVPVARLPVVRRPGSRDSTALVEDHLAALLPFLGRLVTEWRPHVLHAHTGLPDGIVAAAAGRHMGIPVVVTEHMSTIETELADPVALDAYRSLLGPGVRLFGVSPSLASRVAELLGVPDRRIEVLPNPVSDTSFPMADGSGRDPNELLWVGSLGEHKGLETLLRALARLRETRPELRLRLVGVERSAGERANLEALATAQAIESAVSFGGWLARDEVAAAMARAAVFVHPSPSETFGVAAAEAILTGLPVAARRSGGVPWIIELSGGFGHVAEGDDVEAFAGAIEHALEGRLAVDAMTARQRLVETIGEAAVARRAVGIYREEIARAATGETGGATTRETVITGAAGASAAVGTGESSAPTGPASLPRILVATGRDHALPLVAGLPADLLDWLILVVPAWREGAIEAPGTAWPVHLIEAAPALQPRPHGRGPLARAQQALYRPTPTPMELLSNALLAAVRGLRAADGPIEVVALDAPAATLIAGLAVKSLRLAPGALRWLADRWNAEGGSEQPGRQAR